ncbi:MAG: hypothetical protein KDE51_00300 [Anaerolineales bacterium]|nr:hypothetical protein [Anaerolineales bacterium]
MTALLVIVGLVNLGCLIFVLIKLFPAEGALKGILGIICGLYTFIWGWQHANEYENMRNVMIVWSVCVVLSIVLQTVAGSA